jgi:DNA-directed RNA polymerase specialized sigma24 family protein
MESLPPDQRECLRLIYWKGLSPNEAANCMGTNPRTVATWHLRGKSRLAEEFRKRGHWPL